MPELASDKERLATIVGEPMLIYRNIRHLSERLLSYPLFEGVTHVQPSILRDSDGDRVYEDLFSGDWWVNMQVIQCSDGSMVLGLMLASDKTVITAITMKVLAIVPEISQYTAKYPTKIPSMVIAYWHIFL
ncbi:hypothetical protein BJV82DRAFT_583853 [Fennellomyces sp. T-0311]|nr:hypothetical protein BJV82DRAFT_583853 [Fennellomyces sp. T-0311]